MNFVKTSCFTVIVLMVLASSSMGQGMRVAPIKSEQPIREEVVVTYANIPALSGKQFYTMFIFGSSGGAYHDSKPLQFLPSGSIKFNAFQQPGSFDIVLYRYEDFNDSKPRQIVRIPFKAVASRSASSKSAAEIPAPAPPQRQAAKVEKKTENTPQRTLPVTSSKTEPIVKTPPPKVEKPTPKTATKESPKIVTKESVPVKKEGALFHLLPAKNFGVEEEIIVNYELPPLGAGEFYALSISRPADSYAINISPDFTNTKGTLTLKPIYQEGIYELRVYRGNRQKGQREEIIYRQPVTIGTVKRDFTGRYECSEENPKVFGKAASGAPTNQQVMQQIASHVVLKNTEVWLKPEDICLEFFSIQYLTKSNVRVPRQRGSVSYSSFPVKVRYKLVVNDYVRQKAAIREEGIDKVFHFYRNGSRNWEFQEIKAD